MGVYLAIDKHVRNKHPELYKDDIKFKEGMPLILHGENYTWSRCGTSGCNWFFWAPETTEYIPREGTHSDNSHNRGTSNSS